MPLNLRIGVPLEGVRQRLCNILEGLCEPIGGGVDLQDFSRRVMQSGIPERRRHGGVQRTTTDLVVAVLLEAIPILVAARILHFVLIIYQKKGAASIKKGKGGNPCSESLADCPPMAPLCIFHRRATLYSSPIRYLGLFRSHHATYCLDHRQESVIEAIILKCASREGEERFSQPSRRPARIACLWIL